MGFELYPVGFVRRLGRTWRRKAGRTRLGGWQAGREGEFGSGEVPTWGAKERTCMLFGQRSRFAQMSGWEFGEGCGDRVHELSCSWGVWQKLSIRCATLSGGISSARISRPSLQIGQRCDQESGSWESAFNRTGVTGVMIGGPFSKRRQTSNFSLRTRFDRKPN